jgi:hypothetical protein
MEVSTVDIEDWARKQASIPELRAMLRECTEALSTREYVCGECGGDIPTALPTKHPAHAEPCSYYASMVTY